MKTVKKIGIVLFTLVGMFVAISFASSSVYAETPVTSGVSGALTNNQPWDGYTMGFRFKPDVNGQITALRAYSTCSGTGRTVKLYTDAGSLITSASVTQNGGWAQTSITPVNVTAGTYYRIGVYPSSCASYYNPPSPTFPATIGNITIDTGVYSSGDVAPSTWTETTLLRGIPDFDFSTGIAYRSTGTGNAGSSTTSVTINQPSGVTLNDVMIASIGFSGGSGITFTPPSGWTLVTNSRCDNAQTTPQSIVMYYKVATGSEPATYTWTASSAVFHASWISAYSGVNTSSPIDLASCQTSGTSGATTTSITAPSITTTGTNEMIITSHAAYGGAYTFTPPAGMTERADLNNAGARNIESADVSQAAAGATGTKTATISTAAYGASAIVAIKKENTAPSITVNPTSSYGSYTRTGPSNTPFTVSFTATDAEQTGANQLTYYIHTGANRTGTQVKTATFTSGAASPTVAYNESVGLGQGTNTLYLSVYDGTAYSSGNPSFTALRDDGNSSVAGISHNPNPVTVSNQYTVTFTPSDTYSTSGSELRWWIRTAVGGGGTQLANGSTTSGNQVTTGTITDAALTNGANTRYIRVCDGANNCGDTSFTVTKASTPSIASPTKTNIFPNSATLGGNVTDQGASAVTGRGVCYSTTDNTPQLSEGGVTCQSTTGTTGVFTVPVTGLTLNTLYYYRAYATNTQGTAYTSTDSFTTLDGTAGSTTNAPTGTVSYKTTFYGTANPYGFPTTAHFRYATSSPGSCNDSFGVRFPASAISDINIGSGTTNTDFTLTKYDLQPNTTYYYCAITINANGAAWGSVQNFTTPVGRVSGCDPNLSGDWTLDGSCTFPGNSTGVDAGTGTTNTARITLNTGSVLTLNHGQVVARGSVRLQGGSVSLASGGQITRGAVWVPDQDTDGYLDNGTFIVSQSQPANTIRRNVFTGTATYHSDLTNISTFDCSPTNNTKYQNLTGYLDSDGDTYTTGAGTPVCSGASVVWSAGSTYRAAASGADCNDGVGSVYQQISSLYIDQDQDRYSVDATIQNNICVGALSGSYFYTNASGTNYVTSAGRINNDCNDATGSPCVPSAPSIAAASQTQMNVTWSAATGPTPTSYDLQWCQNAGCTPSTTITGVTSTYGHTGRTCNTTYGYRIRANNASGDLGWSSTGYGTTSSCTVPPTVTTSAAASVTASTATLNSIVNPNGFATTITYRYGTSNVACASLPTTYAYGSIGSGTGNVSPNAAGISSLSPSTTYYFCASANNAGGTVYGSVLNFTTSALLANGSACTTGSECQSGFCYVDGDDDTYAPSSGSKTCRASAQNTGTDCYDGNATARPTTGTNPYNGGWRSTNRGDGSFDWDCASGVQMEYPSTLTTYPFSCTTSCSGGSPGWTNNAPSTANCGEIWVYSPNCSRYMSDTFCNVWGNYNSSCTGAQSCFSHDQSTQVRCK